ncbi:hypothetical protein D3C73_1092950 [compost metagenome]
MRHRHINLLNKRHQRFGFTRREVAAEVAGKPLFQILSFTDIDNRPGGIVHTINAGLAGDGFQERFGIKLFGHWLVNVSALHRPWRIAR